MKFRLILFLFLFCFVGLSAQDYQYAVSGVAFYNVENLFDTLNSPDTNDDDFTPGGSYQWTETRYENKLEKVAHVLNLLGAKYCPMGPAVIGLAEVENRKVLEDLLKTGDFSTRNYQIVHQDSPDRRGIDVAFLYNPSLFNLESYKAFPFTLPDDTAFFTRDQLLVSGIMADEKVHIVVIHWPSRRAKSIIREQAAAVTRSIVDSLSAADPQSKVLIMGDFNDDPTSPSVKNILNAKRNKRDVGEKDVFNPFWDYYAKGVGTLGYKGHWNLFDQILLSPNLISDDKSNLTYWKASIFNPDFLIEQTGPFKGYPKRTHSKGIYLNGYSDHLPVIVYLVKQLQ